MASTRDTQTALSVPLTPVLTKRFVLNWQHLTVCLGLVALYLFCCYTPVPHAGGWLHASHGRWLISHHTWPQQNPSLPLAEGMDFVNTTWLSDVLLAATANVLGMDGICGLRGVLVLATLVLLLRSFYVQSGRFGLAAGALVMVVVAWWPGLGIVGPERFAGLCLAALIWLFCDSAEWRSRAATQRHGWRFTTLRWWSVVVVMMLWANLDGSFILGWLFLFCHATGRLVDLLFTRKSLRRALQSRSLQHTWWLLAAATAATCVNPLGVGMWGELLRWDSSLWGGADGLSRPLALASWSGVAFTFCWLVALIVLRWANCRLRTVDGLLFFGLSLLAAWNEHYVGWLVPVTAMIAMTHLAATRLTDRAAVVRRVRCAEADQPVAFAPLQFSFTFACLLITWFGFALSPLSKPMLGETIWDSAQLYSDATPRAVTAYLHEHPADGLIWCPADWGDWLLWDGPPGTKVYANSQMANLPQQARFDYGRMFRGEPDWKEICDRYDIRMVVIDKKTQDHMVARVRRNRKGWHLAYEDDQTMILRRRHG